MEPSFVRQFELGEICVIKVGRRWVVRVDGEDIEISGGKTEATARAFSIAQLGDGPVDVVIFGKGDVIEQRRSFRQRAEAEPQP
jgi:hypothetical protein